MAMFSRIVRAATTPRVLVLLLLFASGAASAANLVVSPAKGNAGATIKVTASGLNASAPYTLEFVGSPATDVATFTSSASGTINATRVLPTLPAGNGKMRLKTGGSFPPGTVVAYTAFTSLAPLTFAPLATNVHAGQSTKFS